MATNYYSGNHFTAMPPPAPRLPLQNRKRGIEIFSSPLPIEKPKTGFDWKENARKAYETK